VLNSELLDDDEERDGTRNGEREPELLRRVGLPSGPAVDLRVRAKGVRVGGMVVSVMYELNEVKLPDDASFSFGVNCQQTRRQRWQKGMDGQNAVYTVIPVTVPPSLCQERKHDLGPCIWLVHHR
jgi:hypothetical protein